MESNDIEQPTPGGDEPAAAPPHSTPVAGAPAGAAPGGDRARGGLVLATLAAGVFGAVLVMLMLGRPAAPAAAPDPEVDAPSGAAVGPDATPVSAGVSKWSRANQQRWVSNHRKSVAFELPAENTVAVWMDRVRPALVVRCLAKGIDVFVVTDTAAAIEAKDDDHTVQLGFDDEAFEEERWPDSVHHDALFAPDGVAFARRLARTRTLRFGFTPHNAAPVTAAFDLTGVADVVETVSKTCRR